MSKATADKGAQRGAFKQFPGGPCLHLCFSLSPSDLLIPSFSGLCRSTLWTAFLAKNPNSSPRGKIMLSLGREGLSGREGGRKDEGESPLSYPDN